MKQLVSRLAKMVAVTAILVFVIALIVLHDFSFGGFASAASYGITAGTIAAIMYERALWRANPLEKLPRISGPYDCVIEYAHDKGKGRKKAAAIVRQTLLTSSISLSTDEISSNTKAAELVKENGQYVLYYTYLTMPKAAYADKNPIQYGTCRLEVKDEGIMRGTYWTSRSTTGDIILTPHKK